MFALKWFFFRLLFGFVWCVCTPRKDCFTWWHWAWVRKMESVLRFNCRFGYTWQCLLLSFAQLSLIPFRKRNVNCGIIYIRQRICTWIFTKPNRNLFYMCVSPSVWYLFKATLTHITTYPSDAYTTRLWIHLLDVFIVERLVVTFFLLCWFNGYCSEPVYSFSVGLL